MLTSDDIRKFARKLEDLRHTVDADSDDMYQCGGDEADPITHTYMRAFVWSVDDDCEEGHDLVDRLFIAAGRLELLEQRAN